MSITTTVEVVLADDTAERAEVMAVAGFLAGYCGHTRISYATDLRLFTGWCHQANLTLFAVRRAHLELFGRWNPHLQQANPLVLKHHLGDVRCDLGCVFSS